MTSPFCTGIMQPSPNSGFSIVICLSLILTIFAISIPSDPEDSDSGLPLLLRAGGDVSNSGLQKLEDVADIHILGMYNEGLKSGIGGSMGLKDIDGDKIDDLYFGFGKFKSNSALVGFRGGDDHIKGIVDMEDTEPELEYHIQQSMWLDTGDMNGDGNLDLVAGGIHGSGTVYLGDGSGFNYYSMIMAGGPDDPLNYQYTDHVLMEDLDGDGLDEALGGYFFNNPYTPTPPPHQVNIFWGTGEKTKIATGSKWMLGASMASGDIDGDGSEDLILGGYYWKDVKRDRAQTGSVFIFFNASRLKVSSEVDPREACDCWIKGSSVEDFFGYSIEIEDLDRDGKDDMIIGSPGSDDPATVEYNTGAIHVFKGDVKSSFPKNLYSNDGADQIIFGSTGKYDGNGGPDYSGDKIGRVYEVGDFDGDQEFELAVAIPGKHTEGNPVHGVGFIAGAVTIHETKEAFPASGGYVKLSYPSKTFTVEGNDPRDVTGWQISEGDINNDNVSDLLIAVPGGDGINNSRQECGEVFLVLGNALRVEGFEISGDGFHEEFIVPGEETVVLKTTYSHTRGPELVGETHLILDPEGSGIEIVIDESNCRILNDQWNSINVEGFSTGRNGYTGWMECEIKLGLDVPIKGKFDIRIELREDNERNVTYLVKSPASVSKSIGISPGIDFLIEGKKTDHEGAWVRENSMIDITGIQLFNTDTGLSMNLDELGLVLLSGSGNTLDTRYGDEGKLSMNSNDLSEGTPRVELVLEEEKFPQSYPDKLLPDLPDPKPVRLRLDDSNPVSPHDVKIIDSTGSSSGLMSPGSVKIDVNATMGEELDPEGSGVDRIELSVNGEPYEPMMEKGGLLGSYYRTRYFEDLAKDQVDNKILFDWGRFGPDTNLGIHYNNFAVSWRGWFISPWEFPFSFRLEGYGSARLEVDGEEVIPWSDISRSRTSAELFLNEGSIHRIDIHFKNIPGQDRTGINLKWLEEDGRFWTVHESYLFYPSNSTMIETLYDRESILIQARCVDGVGHYSEETKTIGRKDDVGPSFDPYRIPEWTGDHKPDLAVRIKDRASDGGPGSGVDKDTIAYRTISALGIESGWKEVEGNMEDNRVDIEFSPNLPEGFRGFVQLRAGDLFGNNATSSSYPLNLDADPPEFELQGLGRYLLTGSEGIVLNLRVKDQGGSGVDGDTVQVRYRKSGDKEWGEWALFGEGGSSTDLLVEDSIFIFEGDYQLQFRGDDNVGNTGVSGPINITIEVPVEDMPPVPVISSPSNGSSFRIGVPMELDATGTTDDGLSGEELTLTWFSNISGYLHSGGKGKVYLETGFHRITLYVDDGFPGHNVSTYVDIEIYDPTDSGPGGDGGGSGDGTAEGEDEGDITWMLVIVILSFLAVIGGVSYMVLKKRREEEVQIGFRERTSDDKENIDNNNS